MHYKFLFAVIISTSWTEVILAQRHITYQKLYWIRYYNIWKLHPKCIWHNEIEDRRFFKDNLQHQFIMHSRIHFQLVKNTNIALGYTYSLQSPQIPLPHQDLSIPEHRIIQEINFITPMYSTFKFQHRFRLEERFIRKNNGSVLLHGTDFNYRLRYRLQVEALLNKSESTHPRTLKIANELMINAGKNIVYNQFDQNRISIALEQRLSPAFSVEAGYIHWYQQRPSGNQFFSREIGRITVHHHINSTPIL